MSEFPATLRGKQTQHNLMKSCEGEEESNRDACLEPPGHVLPSLVNTVASASSKGTAEGVCSKPQIIVRGGEARNSKRNEFYYLNGKKWDLGDVETDEHRHSE